MNTATMPSLEGTAPDPVTKLTDILRGLVNHAKRRPDGTFEIGVEPDAFAYLQTLVPAGCRCGSSPVTHTGALAERQEK